MQHPFSTFKNTVNEPKNLMIFNFSGKNVSKNVMVNTRKELTDIELQNIRVTAGKRLTTVDSPMRAFANTIGIGVRNKTKLENRLYDITQCMMNHPISERSCADQTSFRIMNVKISVGARLIGLVLELRLQHEKIFFQPVFKRSHSRFAALAFGGLFVGEQQIVPCCELCKQILCWWICHKIKSLYLVK